tara:strand:- start:290 stop:436 length:147 start_codon:yes stop_codon:yes gene_type:complete
MASSQEILDSEAILEIEARGFIYGSAVGLKCNKYLIVARKANNLPIYF